MTDEIIIEATPFSPAVTSTSGRRFNFKLLPTIVTAILGLLIIAAGFMFLSKAVKINLNPEAESFEFTSGFQYQLGNRYLMLPGAVALRASLPGYQMLEAEIEVASSADQTFNFDLVKLPGSLAVSLTLEAPARLYIDQQLIGDLPIVAAKLSAGAHDISIRSDRYLDYDTVIEIEGMQIQQTHRAKLSPAWANITVTTNPAGATILVNDQARANTPATVEITQGENTISVRKPGFKTWLNRITVVAQQDQNIATLVLEKSDGKISIDSRPQGATISINNQFYGQTPTKLVLAPGTSYQLQLSKAGYQKISRSITIKADEDLVLNHKLSPIIGVVQLNIEPTDAVVKVDGKIVSSKKTLSLTAKPHTIAVSKPGYATQTRSVTPQLAFTQKLNISLLTEAEAELAAIPNLIETTAGPVLKLITPGKLSLGASRRESGRRSNEIQKQILLTKRFYLAEAEITNAQYTKFRPGHKPGILGRVNLDGDDRPVVRVSWQDAAAYCNWLSGEEGLDPAYIMTSGKLIAAQQLNNGYRLPTEAEWVWAAKYADLGAVTRFPWGDNMPPNSVMANLADESAVSMVPYYIQNYKDNFRGPSPVKHYPANALGIYDLAGNVAEWVHDYYDVKIPTQLLTDPTGPPTGSQHVIRGSSYQHGRFSQLRWSYRDYSNADRPDLGFRVARYVE